MKEEDREVTNSYRPTQKNAWGEKGFYKRVEHRTREITNALFDTKVKWIKKLEEKHKIMKTLTESQFLRNMNASNCTVWHPNTTDAQPQNWWARKQCVKRMLCMQTWVMIKIRRSYLTCHDVDLEVAVCFANYIPLYPRTYVRY